MFDDLRFQIRESRPTDAQVIARFNTEMALESENIRLDSPTILAGVRALLADSAKGTYYVAEIDGRVVGQIMITHEWSDWRNGDIWWIQSVFVEKGFRRRGVFRALYEFVRDRARQSGVVSLRLYVDADNVNAQATYRALGMSMGNYRVMGEKLTSSSPGDFE